LDLGVIIMKKTMVLIIGLALVLASAGSVFAQEEGPASAWTFGAESDFNSKYVWRSLAFSQGAVWQPSAYVGFSGLTFQVWSNFVLNGAEANHHQFNEIDYRFSYKYTIGDFTIEPAYTIYSYPNQDKSLSPTTGETEIQIAYAMGDFTLETTHFFDVQANKGGYVGELGLQFEKETGAGLTLAAAARLLFANATFNAYYIQSGLAGGLYSFVLELGATYVFAGGFYLRPHLEWNNILDSNVRAAVETSDGISLRKPSLFNIGIAAGFSF
jgi:hypothetical protein